MANEVLIHINGKDSSGAAFKSARGNIHNLSNDVNLLSNAGDNIRNLSKGVNLLANIAQGRLLGGAVKSLITTSLAEAQKEGSNLQKTLSNLEASRAKEIAADFERIETSIQRIVLQLLNSLPGGIKNLADAAEEVADRLSGNPTGKGKVVDTAIGAANRDKSGNTADQLASAQSAKEVGLSRLRELNARWESSNPLTLFQESSTVNETERLAAKMASLDLKIAFLKENMSALQKQEQGAPLNAIKGAGQNLLGNITSGGGQIGQALAQVVPGIAERVYQVGSEASQAAVAEREAEMKADMKQRGDAIRQGMMTPIERAKAELEDARKLFGAGAIDAETLARKRDELDALRNPKEEITDALKRSGAAPGLQASESRFLTMGRGQMDPAAKAAVEGNRQRQRQIEQQKQAHDTLKRIEQKWADAAKIEIVNTA